jgi:hypothetical protein
VEFLHEEIAHDPVLWGGAQAAKPLPRSAAFAYASLHHGRGMAVILKVLFEIGTFVSLIHVRFRRDARLYGTGVLEK